MSSVSQPSSLSSNELGVPTKLIKLGWLTELIKLGWLTELNELGELTELNELGELTDLSWLTELNKLGELTELIELGELPPKVARYMLRVRVPVSNLARNGHLHPDQAPVGGYLFTFKGTCRRVLGTRQRVPSAIPKGDLADPLAHSSALGKFRHSEPKSYR
ncbi:hypothetical protein PCASD_23140 [Puccinia coronata f. sp. avenae]|uniref:Uncharacterized protein n=1 Tax=Puccinia coronata f. sp. avenae TaxID=200324 RepID=A0A2N5SA60_9BASI|nr:hypothetical protein PCASD_23140 [Puccinia coronata f. sp. avenae]